MSDTEIKKKEDQAVLDDLEKDFSPAEQAEFDSLSENDGLYKPEKGARINKKKGLVGLLAGVLVGGSIAGFGLLQGLLLPMHVAQQLQRPHLGVTEDFGSDRSSRFMRYALLGDPTRSRLSVVGNFVADRWENKQQRKAGVKSIYDKDGRFAGLQIIDEDKFRNSGLRHELEKQGFDARITSEEFRDGSRGSKLERKSRRMIDIRGESPKRLRILDRRTRRATSTLRVTGATGGRALKLRRGVSWHPLDRIEKRVFDRLAKKRLRDAKNREIETGQKSDADFETPEREGELDRDRRMYDIDSDVPDVDVDELDLSPSDKRLLKVTQRIRSGLRKGGIVVGTAVGFCGIKQFNSAVEAQAAENEEKLVRLGGFGVALGEQIRAGGDDVQAAVVGAYVEQYHDEQGRSVLQDPRLQAENGKQPTADDPLQGGSPLQRRDLPPPINYISDFSFFGSGEICDAVNGLNDLTESAIRGIPGAGEVMDRFQGLVDSGARLATGYDTTELMQKAIDYYAGQQVNLDAAGPLLGSFMNIGTRLLASDQFRFMGAVALTNPEANTVKTSYNAQVYSEFADASAYDRYFNLYEDRSVASGILQKSPRDISTTTTMLANFPSLLTQSITNFLPTQKAAAANTADMYDFPLYGYSEELRDDERFQNPYENETLLEAEFEKRVDREQACHDRGEECPQPYSSLEELNTGRELTDPHGGRSKSKANGKECFGVEVTANASLSYGESPLMDDIPEECAEQKDIAFLRYRFYIADVTSAHSAACFEGRSASCEVIGMGTTSGSTTQSGGVGISPDGFVFPLVSTQSTIKNDPGETWCWNSRENCHHDYNAADIFVPTGTEVLAAKSGQVVRAADDGSSVGARVAIKGEDDLLYYYTHMGAGTLSVNEGDVVSAGDPIGEVGTDADAVNTNRHLHFDVLPSDYTARPVCSGASCTNHPFINVQPLLIDAFNNLPE